MTGEICISNISLGVKPIIISCDITIGDAVKIANVTLREGRSHSVYTNFPRAWHGGRWVSVIEILDASLLAELRRRVEMAATEATRYTFA